MVKKCGNEDCPHSSRVQQWEVPITITPTSKLLDLSGRVSLVTGAARGIGAAIATRLADAGSKIIATDINGDALQEVVASIEAQGGTALAVQADLTDQAGRNALVEKGAEHFGGIDILVNNAGLRDWYSWETLTEEVWDRFMAVNVRAVFFLSQAVAHRMVKRGKGGSIVNITSTAAAVPVPWRIDYNVAKIGVLGMTRSLAQEFGRHDIRVNAVGPGGTRTPGGSGALPEHIPLEDLKAYGEDYRRRLALDVDLLDPDDIARAVLFFASDVSRYMTGQSIYVDAGYTAG